MKVGLFSNISYTFQKSLVKITSGNGVIITVKEYTAFWDCQQCLDFCIRWFSKECLGLRSIQEVYYCYTDYQVAYRGEVSAHNCDNACHDPYVRKDQCNSPSPSSTLKQAIAYDQISNSYCYEDAACYKKQYA